MTLDSEAFTLLGVAVWEAQRVEFGLYGIAAHIAHVPGAQGDKRLKGLTGDAFLRGDPAEFKMTLGQLAKALGDDLLISGPELEAFYVDRNLIAHNFFREYGANVRGAGRKDDPKAFLRQFVASAVQWRDALSGLLFLMMEGAAKKEGRTSELAFTPQQRRQIDCYLAHAGRHLVWKGNVTP